MTFGPGITVHGKIGNLIITSGSLLNEGSIDSDGGGTIAIDGGAATSWSNAAGGSLEANGGTLTLDDAWSSAGQIVVNNSTLNLGGSFTTASLSSLSRTGGAVNLTGALDNTGATLVLDAATGSFNLTGGSLKGGALATLDGTSLASTLGGGTLDGVTVGGTVDGQSQPGRIAVALGGLSVIDGLTLAAGAALDVGGASAGEVDFHGDQSVDGSGRIQLESQAGDVRVFDSLTLGPAVAVHGAGAFELLAGSSLVNQGTIDSDGGGTITIDGAGIWTNSGVLQAENQSTLSIGIPQSVTQAGILNTSASATATFSGDLLGDTHDSDLYDVSGTVIFDGKGTAATPQLLEAMGRDLGAVPAGFQKNFAFGALALAGLTYVKLVDQSANSGGTGAEAVYASSLIVPAGATLDLNGLHLYTQAAQVAGTVVGGTISPMPSGGPITLAVPAAGTINTVGGTDQWSFFGRAGRSYTIVVDLGNDQALTPVIPQLAWAGVQLLDSTGHILGSAGSTTAGAPTA